MGTENGFDGLGFTDVALRGGGAVGVDVVDLLGVDLGVLKCDSHGAGGSGSLGSGGGEVVGVGRCTVAKDFPIDAGVAFLCVIVLLQNNDSGSFAEDKAVPPLIKRARGTGGFVVAGGERFHGAEAAEAETDNSSFTSSRDN